MSFQLVEEIEAFFRKHPPRDRFINIRRLPGQGVVMGVCAGIAAHYGWSVNPVRFATLFVLVTVFGFLFGVLVYFGLAYFMPVESGL
ncbi:MAG: PspC domain-containing protein [bacterium]